MSRAKDIFLLIGVSTLLLLISGLVVALVSWSRWFLLAPIFLVIAAIAVQRLKRLIGLHRNGYFVGYNIYEERHGTEIKSVRLETVNFEPGRDYIVIPTRESWRNQAPDWAKERRDEIFERVMECRPKGWLELPPDWPQRL